MKTIGKIISWIAIAVMLLVGVYSLVSAVSYQQPTQDILQTYPEDIAENRIYKLYDGMPVCIYAEDDEDTVYVLMAFPNASEHLMLASLSVDRNTLAYEQINAYMEDDTQQIGDLLLSCYAFCNGDISDSDQQQYYDEALEMARSTFAEAQVAWIETNQDIEYMCDIDGDYQSVADSNSLEYAIVGVSCLVIAVVNIVRMRRKDKTDPPAGEDPLPGEPQAHYDSPMEDPLDLTNSGSKTRHYSPTEDPADLTNRRW